MRWRSPPDKTSFHSSCRRSRPAVAVATSLAIPAASRHSNTLSSWLRSNPRRVGYATCPAQRAACPTIPTGVREARVEAKPHSTHPRLCNRPEHEYQRNGKALHRHRAFAARLLQADSPLRVEPSTRLGRGEGNALPDRAVCPPRGTAFAAACRKQEASHMEHRVRGIARRPA